MTASTRIRPPKHAPHPYIAKLRANGWTLHQIAIHVGASVRAVSRWAAGDTRPLPIYEETLDNLLVASPPRVVSIRDFVMGAPLWSVRARSVQTHLQLVAAESADGAVTLANEQGWGPDTCDQTESVEVLGATIFRSGDRP